jgi:hypothetical protein
LHRGPRAGCAPRPVRLAGRRRRPDNSGTCGRPRATPPKGTARP